MEGAERFPCLRPSTWSGECSAGRANRAAFPIVTWAGSCHLAHQSISAGCRCAMQTPASDPRILFPTVPARRPWRGAPFHMARTHGAARAAPSLSLFVHQPPPPPPRRRVSDALTYVTLARSALHLGCLRHQPARATVSPSSNLGVISSSRKEK